jgi:hypothetical protein
MADITAELDPFCSERVATRPTVTKLLRGRQDCVSLYHRTACTHVCMNVWGDLYACRLQQDDDGWGRKMKERRSGRHVSEYPQTRCISWWCDSVTDIIACFNLHIICIYYFPFLSILSLFLSMFLSLFLSNLFISVTSYFLSLFLHCLVSLLNCSFTFCFFLPLLILYIHIFPTSFLVFPTFSSSLQFFIRSFSHFLSCLSQLRTDTVPVTWLLSSSSLHSRYAAQSSS